MLDLFGRFAGESPRRRRRVQSRRGDFTLPRYDYRCTVCGHQFELRQGFDSPTVMDCLACGADSNRKIHAPPVIFKGSGWYVNDYGKGRGNNGLNGDREKSEEKREKRSDGASSESAKSGASETATATAGKDD